MTGPEPNLTRTNRKKRRKWSNNLLNILIAIVVVLIVVISATIFGGGKDDNKATDKEALSEEEAVANDEVDTDKEDESLDKASNTEKSSDKTADTEEVEADDEKSGVVTYVSSDDELIKETIINTAWEPVGTKQTGNHVSLYDGTSVDWNEKQQALAYATGLDQNSMIFWKIKNGGGPSKSIGIVSSKDSAEKYRVYLEWVEGKGWQPVKMDVLTSLNFDY